MIYLSAFLHWLGTPFRCFAGALRTVVNLSGEQMRALFSVAMMSGIFSLSLQNIWFTFIAKSAVDKGELFRPFFGLIQEQMRFNSALIAWFAVIMGLIVFGADYFRAKLGDKEVGFGRGEGGGQQ
jgi:hypothetical protein